MKDWILFNRNKKRKEEEWSVRTMFGPYLNFAATEAYKLLRTNLMFSFSDEGSGRVIGFTSSVQSEGKSSTACNTAYALAEAGYRVLLLEGDLRRPSLSSKLNIRRIPGLTNILVSKQPLETAIVPCGLMPNMDILLSGDIPPNPSELLASNRMERLMQQLRNQYDYVVLDLPPVTAVSDALAVSKLVDGFVVVVRGGVSDQQMLAETMRQLELVKARILGFVYRDMDLSNKKSYGKKNYKYQSAYRK